jgi:tripartite ATP-independent transporter DctP family solute receptor
MSVNVSRRLAVGGFAAGLCLPGIIAARGDTPQFKLRLANNRPADHPVNVRQREAAARILEESEGRISLSVHPESQLGVDTEAMAAVKAGTLDFVTLAGSVVSTYIWESALAGVGYAFTNYAAIWAAMDGEVGRYIGAAADRGGIYLFEKAWDNGFRQVSNSLRPIDVPADLKGMKIRIPASTMLTSLFLMLGAEPVALSLPETYAAIKAGVVDGQENALVGILGQKYYEVQKYASLTRHVWDPYLVLGNGKNWAALPPDVRKIISVHLNRSAEDQRLDVANSEASTQRKLLKLGMKFNEPDPDPFRKALADAGYYTAWKSKFGPDAWALLEKYTGKITA